MNINYLNKLEYNKILEIISKYAKTYLGKKLCLELQPFNKKNKVHLLIDEIFEACNLYERKGNIPICDFNDISLSIKNLESSISLSAKSLLDIATIFKISRNLKDYLYLDKDFDLSNFNIISEYFSNLYVNKNIEDKIFSSIIDDNTISDDASTCLANLRRNRRKLENQIKDNLNKIIHSNPKAIMEPIVTIRNDRYVIPVKEDFKGSIKGFIHDVSSSGSTVFIEPISIFEINNNINNIKNEELIEIEKILYNLSSLLFGLYDNLSDDVEIISKLDCIFARVNFSRDYSCVCPIINEEPYINLIQARHPLINKSEVVPIDISIGKGYSSLIITGPNTGGKTVTLKTIGLLTLMACSGIPIPANSKSSIYVFDNVFSDIGDEQSIQESLSTFSSHMTNIINILNNVTSNSLVLLDELGSGTDPIEGAALAVSILEHFHNMSCITVATTHYQEVKNYALTTDGFENASSEFDVENLKPTYKLLIGIPGKSNAFAISKRLGLSEDILIKANSLLKSSDISIEELLKNIYDDKISIETEKEEITKNLNQIETLRKSLEQENMSVRNEKNNSIEKSKQQAKDILLNAKEDANDIIKELNDLYDSLKAFEEIDYNNMSDSEIANLVKHYFYNERGSLKRANELRNKLNKSFYDLSSNNKTTKNNSNSNILKSDLKIGMKMKINNFNDIATVYSLSGKANQIQIKLGNIKMNIKVDDIVEIVKEKDNKNSQNSNLIKSNYTSGFLKSKNVLPEINVIGQTVEEAIFIIDKYLDDCYIAKLQNIRIVHGKGTGKLREGIHTFLKKNPHVKSYRLGTFGEGEMGVTIVELDF